MYQLHDYAAATRVYRQTTLPPVKIVLTGTGRVANGAVQVLRDMNIHQVFPDEFLYKTSDLAVFTQLACKDYAARKDGQPFHLSDFFKNPGQYKSTFAPFAHTADIMINGIYWDNRAPAFFTQTEMADPRFHIRVIADVTCDIAPAASIPATLRPTTIANPVFGFDPKTGKEIAPFSPHGIDMMTIDNLPNEMPRDASISFGNQFIEHILPELLKENSPVIERATVADRGVLGKHFQYLNDYVF
ncbi:MAG TPA: hypothetical protein ENJ20_06650 [Bacteroidetes bacterium]|nr:hypothetical protein [Bacteroidota bacterium]